MSRLDVLTKAPVAAPVVEDYEAGEARPCDVCGLPLGSGYLWRHSHHDDDCPNRRYEKAQDDDAPHVDCTCDNETHAECCPLCAFHVIVQRRALVRWYWSGTRRGWTNLPADACRYVCEQDALRARARIVKAGQYNVRNAVDVLPLTVAERDFNEFLAGVQAMSNGSVHHD